MIPTSMISTECHFKLSQIFLIPLPRECSMYYPYVYTLIGKANIACNLEFALRSTK